MMVAADRIHIMPGRSPSTCGNRSLQSLLNVWRI